MTSKEIYQQYLEAKKKEEQDEVCSEMFHQASVAGEQIRAFMDGLVEGGLTENQAFKIVMGQVQAQMMRDAFVR